MTQGNEESPAARGRGLKHEHIEHEDANWNVARRARAWIETELCCKCGCGEWSPAARGRGLKRLIACSITRCSMVARRARAWIETPSSTTINSRGSVARRARAWIE